MAFKVYIPQDIREEGKQYLRERGYEIKMGSGISTEIMKKEIADCDAVLARTAVFNAEVLEEGKKLKVIARHGVGVDNVDLKRAAELGIYVTNCPESNANTVAEHTIGLLIALARNMVRADKALRAGDFEFRNREVGMDIEGKTLGIIGVGKIGSRVGKKAYHGLSMRVIGYDKYLDGKDFPTVITSVDNVEEVYENSDFVSLHVPSNEETKFYINTHTLSLFKPNAFLINASRGPVVNEEDLLEGLKSDKLAGAALDVFIEEPPPQDHPFFSMDNIIVTPHNAGLTKECMVRMGVQAAQGIDEVLSGKEPTWPVNHPVKKRSNT